MALHVDSIPDVDECQKHFFNFMKSRATGAQLELCDDVSMLRGVAERIGVPNIPRTKKKAELLHVAIRDFFRSMKQCITCKDGTASLCVGCEEEHIHLRCTLASYPILAVENHFPVPGGCNSPRCHDCARDAVILILKDVERVKARVVKDYFRIVLKSDHSPKTVCHSLLPLTSDTCP